MDVKVECVNELVKSRCDTCLSVGRKLAPIYDNIDLFCTFMGYSISEFDQNMFNSIMMCWECRANLHKFERFKSSVHGALELLRSAKKIDEKSFSTLTQSNTKDNFDLEIVHKDYEEPKQEIILKIEVPAAVIDNDITTDIYTDNHATEDYSSSDEPLIACKSESTNDTDQKLQKTTSKRKRTVKFKIINKTKDTKKMFHKVNVVDEKEMLDLIERERTSAYYEQLLYKCESCALGFKNKSLLAKHKEQYHKKSSGPLRCDVCASQFTASVALRRHRDGHKCAYKCTACDHAAYSQRHARWHYDKCHKRVVQCVECEVIFDTRASAAEHYRGMHETFVCDLCGIVKRYRHSIEKHIRVNHSPYECKLCVKRFARKKYLLVHNRVKHSEQKLEDAYCVECNKHFSNKYAYRAHLNESVKHKPGKKVSVPCPLCDKVFSKKTYMKNHYEFVHLNILKHRCEQCDKSFTRRDHLVRHTRLIHEGIAKPKNKICYLCGRGFSCNMILNNHIRTHTGERPFPCGGCGARFAQSAALAAHRRSLHKHLL